MISPKTKKENLENENINNKKIKNDEKYNKYRFVDENKNNKISLLKAKFINFLLQGEQKKTYKMLLNEISKGIDVQKLYLNIISSALQKIGELWNIGEVSTNNIHHFTQNTTKIMNQLQIYFPQKEKNGYTAVSVTPGSERHNIGLRMVNDFLEMEGWNIFFLKGNLPINNIINAIKENNADLLIISATMSYNLNSVENIINTVKSKNELDIKILGGGRAFNKINNVKNKFNIDGYASNAKEAVTIANELCSV